MIARAALALALPLALALAGCGDDQGAGDASMSEGTGSTGTLSEGTGSTETAATSATTSAGTDSDATTAMTTSATATTSDGTSGGDPLVDALLAIDGLTVQELDPLVPGTRLFALTLLQPADHDDLGGLWFPQRLTLFHRDAAAPMILATSGYHLLSRAYLSEPALLVDGNQLAVEQRFFGPSRPDPADWSLLTIAQAAADHHRIVDALAPIYSGAWAGTGASKGGMTSVYHRRFYPDDLAATIAYVAPQSLAAEDPRYEPYLDAIGEPACAQAIKDAQAEALVRRDALTAMLIDYAAAEAFTYDHIGLERAFEFAVLESRFAFWQYGSAADCPAVPGPGSSDQAYFDWLDQISGFGYFADDTLDDYGPYFYQAATELGAPKIAEEHLGDLRLFPGEDTAALFAPLGLPITFDPAAMPAVGAWLASEGERFLFIYGGRDPWSAGAFELGGAADSHLYGVADGNHGTHLADLGDAEYSEAVDSLFGWLGAATPPADELLRRRLLARPWPRVGR